jgi:ribosomal protein L3 glutamine methyltransferase
MARLSHSEPGRKRRAVQPRAPLGPVAQLLRNVTRRLQRARLHYGHGTDNARDDAAALIWHALRLPLKPTAAQLARAPLQRQLQRLEALLARRIRERVPVVYLTHRCWFAGLEMYVDERVLIPRSPLAELIVGQFAPWIDAGRVRRIVDVGTGSGCIAIACALAFARARVDALDISGPALEVARLNIRRHGLQRRVRALESDHFSALGADAYDIIVSNPPYVGRREMTTLPAEYRHEPQGALAAGTDGLDSVRALLRGAARRLQPGGILVVEVGNTERAVRASFPQLPFTWLDFAHGGGGVFLLTREQLRAAHRRKQD